MALRCPVWCGLTLGWVWAWRSWPSCPAPSSSPCWAPRSVIGPLYSLYSDWSIITGQLPSGSAGGRRWPGPCPRHLWPAGAAEGRDGRGGAQRGGGHQGGPRHHHRHRVRPPHTDTGDYSSKTAKVSPHGPFMKYVNCETLFFFFLLWVGIKASQKKEQQIDIQAQQLYTEN